MASTDDLLQQGAWISKMFIKESPPAGPAAEETLLAEIRDELRKRPT